MGAYLQAKGGITSDIIDALTQNNVTLSKMRKKRQISETLATPDSIGQLELAGSFPIHKTTQVRSRQSFSALVFRLYYRPNKLFSCMVLLQGEDAKSNCKLKQYSCKQPAC